MDKKSYFMTTMIILGISSTPFLTIFYVNLFIIALENTFPAITTKDLIVITMIATVTIFGVISMFILTKYIDG